MTATTLSAGTMIGPYEVVALLGAGGMGQVYQARDSRLNRLVALKVLSSAIGVDAERRRRFVQEAQLASSLQHPHIVTVFDIGTAGEIDYLAMELVRGRPLDQVIPAAGLRLADALRCGSEIADALPRRTRWGSSTGTSSRATSWSPVKDASRFSTSAWRRSSNGACWMRTKRRACSPVKGPSS